MHRDIRIGFAYDSVSSNIESKAKPVEAEYEDEKTLSWLRSTLKLYGIVEDIVWGPDIISKILKSNVDVIFNITEAAGSRNRESLLPALAESVNIPFTGSDAVAMGVSLDKYLTKVIARHIGVPTPNFVVLYDQISIQKSDMELSKLKPPLIVKPNTGGSSMGIRKESRVDKKEDIISLANWIFENYNDSVLVEEFVSGKEYTVGILEDSKIEVLPIAEIGFSDNDCENFYSYELKDKHDKNVICPANIPEYIRRLMKEYSKAVFCALGCRDMARIDFRVSLEGDIKFIEINPLPGLSPFFSTYPIQARTAGISPEMLIGILVKNALKRKHQKSNKIDK